MLTLPVLLALTLAVLLAGSALAMAWSQRRSLRSAAHVAATLRARGDDLAARLHVADAALGVAEAERAGVEDALHALQRRADRQGELLGIAAHDLRNPLGNIIGFTELLLEDGLADKTRGLLTLVRDDAQRMLSIIQEVLEAQVVEEDGVPLQPKMTELGALAADVVRWHEAQAQRKGLTLRFAMTDSVVAPVDAAQLQRVLDNLISNAVKFSPKGKNVWVRVAQAGSTARLSVRDEGPGLTAEDRQKLFGKLQRLSARPTDGEASTGLGLYIARNIARAHGGDIEVDSTPGQGATFTVTLPLQRPKPVAPADAPMPAAVPVTG